MTFTPCSPRHKSCSPAHADLVASYRSERHRQELLWEKLTGGYPGDAEHAKATGAFVITFDRWLRAHKREGKQ